MAAFSMEMADWLAMAESKSRSACSNSRSPGRSVATITPRGLSR